MASFMIIPFKSKLSARADRSALAGTSNKYSSLEFEWVLNFVSNCRSAIFENNLSQHSHSRVSDHRPDSNVRFNSQPIVSAKILLRDFLLSCMELTFAFGVRCA